MAKNQIIICLQILYNSNKRVEERRHTGGNACSITKEYKALLRKIWHFHQDRMYKDYIRFITSFEISVLQ